MPPFCVLPVKGVEVLHRFLRQEGPGWPGPDCNTKPDPALKPNTSPSPKGAEHPGAAGTTKERKDMDYRNFDLSTYEDPESGQVTETLAGQIITYRNTLQVFVEEGFEGNMAGENTPTHTIRIRNLRGDMMKAGVAWKSRTRAGEDYYTCVLNEPETVKFALFQDKNEHSSHIWHARFKGAVA